VRPSCSHVWLLTPAPLLILIGLPRIRVCTQARTAFHERQNGRLRTGTCSWADAAATCPRLRSPRPLATCHRHVGMEKVRLLRRTHPIERKLLKGEARPELQLLARVAHHIDPVCPAITAHAAVPGQADRVCAQARVRSVPVLARAAE
jgi:hypothetical protein